MEDWQILVNLGARSACTFDYSSASAVQSRYAEAVARHRAASRESPSWRSHVRCPAQHWLQASNPSERWKWDFMFQDLPPVKGSVDPSSLPLPPGMIPMKEVK